MTVERYTYAEPGEELRFDFKVDLVGFRDEGERVRIDLFTPDDALYFVMIVDRTDRSDPHHARTRLGMLKEAVRECRLHKQDRDAAPAHEKLSDGTLLRLGLEVDGLVVIGVDDDLKICALSRSGRWPKDGEGTVEHLSFEEVIGRWEAARVVAEGAGR